MRHKQLIQLNFIFIKKIKIFHNLRTCELHEIKQFLPMNLLVLLIPDHQPLNLVTPQV